MGLTKVHRWALESASTSLDFIPQCDPLLDECLRVSKWVVALCRLLPSQLLIIIIIIGWVDEPNADLSEF